MEEDDFGYWQCCPKCFGQKVVSEMPNIPITADYIKTEQAVFKCGICNGAGIIARPLLDFEEMYGEEEDGEDINN